MEQAEFDLAEAANQDEKKKLSEEKQWCCSASRPINGRRSGAQANALFARCFWEPGSAPAVGAAKHGSIRE